MDSVEILQQLLKKRGIEESEISEFLSPKPKKTYDPFLLHHMREGVDLLLDTVKKGGSLCIYGDYDADGITSVCILMEVLHQLTGKEISYYIPSRFEEGYGLNKDAIKKIAEKGTSLIITVDCGTMSYEEVEYAKELGMDVIVTDHHDLGDKPSDCIMINPKKDECRYPFSGLAGCGVAFKFAQGIVKAANLDKKTMNRCLDLVAIGTIADIAPLVDENRTLVKYGLRLLNEGKRTGLRILGDKISRSRNGISSEDVAYGIVPHINAAGRMRTASIGVELLLDTNEIQCSKRADRLVGYNEERKRIQKETVEECLRLIEEQCNDSHFPIVKAENAHEGIIGIVAGNLKDRLKRPVAIVVPGKDALKGSARSTEKVDIFQLMTTHRELMEKLGGHRGACGFSLKEKNLVELRERLQEDLEQRLADDPNIFSQEEIFDMTLFEENITLELAKTLEKMEPFGNHNPRPLFQLEGVHLSNQKRLGETGSHGRFAASFPGGKRINCILFGEMDKYEKDIYGGKAVTMKGQLQVHRWQGREELQMTVKGIYTG